MGREMDRIAMIGLLLAVAAAGVKCAPEQHQEQAPQDQGPKSPQTDQGQKQPPKPPAQPQSASSSATKDTSTYDPFHAEQDVDVGTFYMHKGDIDAAIPRFEDAIRLRANFAKPRLLLAECYEKKHEPATAVKYLKEYLKVYPDAPDRKSVEKKIEKLSNK